MGKRAPRWRRWLGCGAMLLAGVGLVLTSIGVVVAFRSAIVRKDVAVDAAWARLEGAYRRRADLVPPFLQTLRAVGLDRTPQARRLESAYDHTAVLIGSPTILEEPETFAEFLSAHRDLGEAFEALRPIAASAAEAGAGTRADLLEELDRVDARISNGSTELARSVEDYNASIARFPLSGVARLFGFRAKTPPSAVGEIGGAPYNAASAEGS